MKRRKRVLGVGSAAALAVAAAGAVAVVNLQGATAAESNTPIGFAAQNGGTTGGAGGTTVTASTGTEIHEALCNRASSDTPITIMVDGTITVDNTEKVSGDSCNTAAGVIELKEISNVTLEGVGTSAVFDQIGIHVRGSSNIILQNLHVKNVKKSGSPTSNGGDAIGMESDVSNVWVDHNTLEASGGEDEGYDSLIDMKADTTYVTVSYNVLKNSGRGGLVGSSDSDTGNGPVTFHHNYYENIDSRTPLLRSATAHIFDNYYNGLNKSGINPRNGGEALVENNYFKDSQDVLGTFYTDLSGTWETSGNILDNVTWTDADDENNPAGDDMTSTGSVDVPYSYTLDDASCVPNLVLATAGVGTDLAVSDGSCDATVPSTGTTTTAAPSTTTTDPEPSTTTTVTSTTGSSTPSGTNLALSAGVDGSSKASGSRYGNVNDDDLSTFWSPSGSTGDISLKWSGSATVGSVVIKQTSSTVTSWQLLDADTDEVLASGSSVPSTISFDPVSVRKLTFRIAAASATPQIAEYQAYAS